MARPAERLQDDRQEGSLLDHDRGGRPSPSEPETQGGSGQSSVGSVGSAAHHSMRGQNAGIPKENQPVSPTASGNASSSKPGSGKPKPAEPHSSGKSGGGKGADLKDAAINKAVDKIPGGKKDADGNPVAKGGAEKAVDKAAGKGAELALDATGAGAAVAKPVGKAVEKVGVRRISKVAVIGAVIMCIPFFLLLSVFTYVATHPWEAAKEVITNSSIRRFALNAAKQAGTSTVSTIIDALSYETDYKPGAALAATGRRPEPGTLLDTISKIDFEKSKNRYKQANCPYDVVTKKVVAFDGKQRSVIAKVVDKSGASADVRDVKVFDCVLQHYPVIETMMRSPEARKINKQMNVNLAYAEKKDSELIQGKSKEEVKESLLKKTTDRVWRNGKDSAGILYPDSCQKDYKPTGEKADKAIKKIANDLLCGIKPEDIKIDYPVEDLPTDNSIPTNKQKVDEADVICVFYEKLNKNPEDAKKQRRDRSVSSARAGVQALTLADTGVAGEIQTDELNNDFYKLANFASSRAYNQEINGSSTGKHMDPEAIPTRAIGLTKAYFDSLSDPNRGGGGKQLLSLKEECNTFKKTKPTTATQNVLNIQSLAAIAKGEVARTNSEFYGGVTSSFVTTSDLIIRTVRLVSNVSNSGAEGGENNFNRMTVGAKNTMHNYTISLLGGAYQNDAEAAADSIALETIKRNEDKQSNMIARLFNTKNPRSLVSRIAAGSTATPRQITENTTRYAINLLNPIRTFAEVNTQIAYIGYGESNKAMAAGDDDREYWKIDTAGTGSVDALKNAAEIEAIKKGGSQNQLFAKLDTCMESYYPDKEALDEDTNATVECKVMRQTDQGKAKAGTVNAGLIKKYAQYKGNMNFYTAWAKASSDEQDDSIYAKGENSSGFGVGGAVGADPDGPQSDPGADTSKTPCPAVAGITDAGEAQTFGIGGKPKNKIRLCNVQGIIVNVSIASGLNNLINDARNNAGISFSGGGFRTQESQVILRKKHCGTSFFDIYEKRSKFCKPPTAIPGSSLHEQGEAIDFSGIGDRGSAKFVWLSTNAAKYGLKNLPSEPWHWSRTGG